METYKMIAKCRNCGKEWGVDLQKGISADKQESDCPYCGCETTIYHRPIYEFEGNINPSL